MGVTTVRRRDWLARFIRSPDQVLAEGDPIAADLHSRYKVNMPNLGLGPGDVAAIVEYLAAETAAVAQGTRSTQRTR
jgi:protein SCO1/2